MWLTWINVIVILILAVYLYDGYRQGFLRQAYDLMAIVVSFLLALKFFQVAATILTSFGLATNLVNPVGFLILWSLLQLIFYLIGYFALKAISLKIHRNKINQGFGVVAGLVKGTITIAIFLILLLTLPIPNKYKDYLSESYLAGNLINKTASFESQLNRAFWRMNNSVGFLALVPQELTNEKLNFRTNNYKISEKDENLMFALVNKEREKRGLPALKQDLLLRNVARAHSMDMVSKGYFSHLDLQNQLPSDRLLVSEANFQTAGENLALAPTVNLAHVGLMNSPEHYKNIVDPDFRKIGIGVIDVGTYGKMFTQVFTD